MRALLSFAVIAAVLSLTASPADASVAGALDYDDARHLLNRTGFGATQAEIERYVGLSREQAAKALLAAARTAALTPPPPEVVAAGPLRYPRRGADASDEELRMFRQQQIREGLELRGWWVGEMLSTPSPLTERMTLFWHNHFVSSQQKVQARRADVSAERHAARACARKFRRDAARDRARSGDDRLSRQRPEPQGRAEREFRARADGALHAGRRQLQRARRQGGGARVHRLEPRPRQRRIRLPPRAARLREQDGAGQDRQFRRRRRDRHPARATVDRRIRDAESCGANSSRPSPIRPRVRRIAARFRDSGYDIKVALQRAAHVGRVLRDAKIAARWSSRRSMLVVGTLRQLGMRPGDTIPFAVAAAGMGQSLFAPPNVRGWPGQETWINTSTLLARKQFLDRLLRARWHGSACAPSAAGDAMSGVRSSAMPMRSRTADKARTARFLRNVDRGIRSVQFDSAAWIAQWKSGWRCARARRRDRRLLFAVAPQTPPHPSRAARAGARARARRRPTSSNDAAYGGSMMDRRDFLRLAAATPMAGLVSGLCANLAFGAAPARRRLPPAAGADRAQGRQRRTQYAGPVRGSGLLRIAARSSRLRATRSFSFPTPPACIRRSRRCCRCGAAASSRCCRASAIPSPTCRIFARSRSGTRRRAATSICRTAG